MFKSLKVCSTMLSASAIMSCTPAPALATTYEDVQAAKERACEAVAVSEVRWCVYDF